MASPILDAANRYRATRAKLLADAAQVAEAIRRDLGQPRERRQFHDHPGGWSKLQRDVVSQLNGERQRALDELVQAKAEVRRWVFRVPVDRSADLNRTMAEVSYRAAREAALALPFGETGLRMALERMELAVLTGDEPMMAALCLLAEQRGGDGGTVWDSFPKRWAEATSNKHTHQRLEELAEVEVAIRQLSQPERWDPGRLTPLPPEPTAMPTLEPPPSLGGDSGGEPA